MSDTEIGAAAPLPPPVDFISHQAYVWAYEELRKRHALEFAQLVQGRHEVLTAAERHMELDLDGPRLEQVLVLASKLCNVPIESMVGRSRTRAIVRARMVAMWGARQFTALSFPQIGERFERDHSTVVNAVQRVEALLADGDAHYTELTQLLKTSMRAHISLVGAAA